MSENFNIFCLSIYNECKNFYEKNNLIPVGLKIKNFENGWFRDHTGLNISNKNSQYGEYSFHYWLWRNYLKELSSMKWIGFCTYRLFWTKQKTIGESIQNLQQLSQIILKEPLKSWNEYDVILTKSLKIRKIKNMKIIKNYGLKMSLMNPKIFFKNQHTLYDHFSIFHGKDNIDIAISCVDIKDRKDFKDYLNTSSFNAENMFIVKNSDILEAYYSEVFKWLEQLNNKINFNKFKGYQVRMPAFLAEHFLSFWFNKYYKVFENNIIFFDTHKFLKKN